MKISEICSMVGGRLICGGDNADSEIVHAFASDLMSDVLTTNSHNLLLITGLANVQAIRTAEMSDIDYILFVRDKLVTPEMKKLAEEIGITLITSPGSMFRVSGVLYGAGLKPIY